VAVLTKPLPFFRTPLRILVPKLLVSRDLWKAKATERKHKLKLAKLRIRDLELSRDNWRQKASEAQNAMAELQRQLEQSRQENATLRDENERFRQEAQKK
jgi:hypothetical protein